MSTIVPHIVTPMTEVLVVGRLRDPDRAEAGWDVLGVFFHWPSAVDACIDAAEFIIRFPINKAVREDVSLDAHFPHKAEDE
jgi:hypothetical protein